MSIKIRLTLLSFMQFFVWGAWLITIATYFFTNNMGSGAQFGAIFSTLAIASIIMPPLTGILADRWISAERLYGILHILYGLVLFYVPSVRDADTLYYVILVAMMFYMPTISLSNAVSYTILKKQGLDVVKEFPPIRVWGTIGFIVAMWITNLSGSKANADQFMIGGIGAILLGLYSFTLPSCPPQRGMNAKSSWIEQLGLNAFKLFGQYKMALFFLFSMLLGAALQLTNMYGDTFLDDFRKVPAYGPESFVVRYSTIIMSISQISETIFILTIPFILRRFGIKKVMLFSMLAWFIRFGLFAYGNPGEQLWMIVLSCIVYGLAFDFFNISGSLFVETATDHKMRSSAQGLFMMMSNGLGAFLGSIISGYVIDRFFTLQFTTLPSLLAHLGVDAQHDVVKTILGNQVVGADGSFAQSIMLRDWQPIWISFSLYAGVVALLFMLLFKHKHDPKNMTTS